MKLKNLFYLLVAMTLVFAACEKGTDDTDKKPNTEQPGDENPGDENPGDENPGDENPGDDQPGDEQPGDENPGDEQPGDEPEDKEPILTLTSAAVMEFTAEGGTGEIAYTLENIKEGVNVTATCEATWVTNIAVAEKVTFAVAANEGEAREAVVVVAYDTKKFEVAVKQTAKEVVDDTVRVVSAVATEGTSNGDMNYHSVAFKLSNNDTIAIEFRTDDNNYLTLGEYTDSWSDYAGNGGTIPGYINYAFKNGESIGWVSTTVAYENEAYIVNFAVTADYTTTEEYTYTGTIEGLVKPVENEVVDSWSDIETTFTNCSQITIMSDYSQITFIDAKNTLYAEFNHTGIGGEVAVVAGTYTFTTATDYNNFDLTSTTCNGEAPTSGTIVVADNGDATCTFTFDFVVKGCSYKATYTGKSIDFLGKATDEQPGDEITDPNNVTLTTMGEIVIGTYYTEIPLSDNSGNNSLTLILYPDSVVDGYPVVGSYPYWQSDPGYVWATDRFSFAKNSLKVGGTTYSNNDIAYAPKPTCNVAEDGTITLTFTVGGDARTFTYYKK